MEFQDGLEYGRWENRTTNHSQKCRDEYLLTSESQYHARLLSRVCPIFKNNSILENTLDCTLIGENNDSVSVHGALISQIWPPLTDLKDGKPDSCHCLREELVIILPQTKMATILSFINLVYTGFCKIDGLKEEQEVMDLLENLGVVWSLSLDCCASDTLEASSGDVSAAGESNASDNIPEVEKAGVAKADDVLTDVYRSEDTIVDGGETEDYTCIGQCFEGEDDEVSVTSVQNELEHCIFEKNWTNPPIKFNCEEVEKEKLCSKFCSFQCHIVLKSWTPETVNLMGTLFKSEKGITETKNNLIRHLQSQANIGVTTDSYRVHGQSFCLKFFSRLTNLSEFIVKSVILDFWKGYSQYKHGNLGSLKHLTVATTSFICWLKQFSEAYGQFAPDTNTTVLSYWLNKQFLFNLYIDETTAPHLSAAAFYQNFKTHFGFNRSDKSLPHVIISKYSSHSICSQCVALNNNRRQAKTEFELRQATDLRNQHKVIFGEARRTIQEIKQSAISFPSDNLFLQGRFFYHFVSQPIRARGHQSSKRISEYLQQCPN